MKLSITGIAVLAVMIFTWSPASAIQGGVDVTGDTRVAALLSSQTATRPGCSASYVDSWVVITAAHCVTRYNSEQGELAMPAENYWVSGPGEDVSLGNVSKRIRVAAIFRSEGYVNTWNPSKGDYRTQKDDIAFMVLEKEAVGISTISIASQAEVITLKQSAGTIRHVGYGSQVAGSLNGKPYEISLVAHPLGSARYGGTPALDSHTITTNETGDKAICGGDSGSPWYSVIDGQEKLIAVTVGGSGCGSGSGINGALGTVASLYLNLFDSAQLKASELKSQIVAKPTEAKKLQTITCKKGSSVRKVTSTNPKCPNGFSKLTTITCTKGKIVKKVTEVKPRCPSGYKKK